jgi:capsular exopolysaccharide synthesis family protein
MNSPDDTKAILEQTDTPNIGTPSPEEFLQYFKGLVGQIEISLPRHGCRVLLLSSSMPGEGTTEVTVGLGLTLATAMGRKTAIVDCNVHHPEMHVRFGTQEVGLGEYLTGEVPLERALANTVVPNVYIMSVGRHLASLVGFGKEELESFVASLRSKFDYVLIDAAPLGTYPDCAVLCDKVDAVVLVVRHGSTRREVVKRTRDIIVRTGGKILGVVLNRRRFPIPEFLYRRL